LKDEALDRTMWRARFGRGFGPVVRQATWMNEPEICLFSRVSRPALGLTQIVTVRLRGGGPSRREADQSFYVKSKCNYTFSSITQWPQKGRI
jgi:hypothetical protein